MSLRDRLERLEAKHAGPGRIWVTIDGSGVYEGNGETITEAEFEARYGDDETIRLIVVEYVNMAAPDQLSGE